MEATNIKSLLIKHRYQFIQKDNKIIVKLNFSQRVIIDLSKPNNVSVSSKLVGWNFLTGLIAMSLKNAIIYNAIGILIFICLALYLQTQIHLTSLVYVIVACVIWVAFWVIYYNNKAITLKKRITH